MSSNDRECSIGLRVAVIALALSGVLLGTACDPPLDNSSEPSASADIADAPSAASEQADAAPSLPVSGDVVLAGGWSKANKSAKTAEFYDPATGKFRKTGSMAVSTGAAAGALLTVGVPHPEILVAGGFTGSSKFTKKTVSTSIKGSATNDLEIFDPATGKFTPANAPLTIARVGATATALPSGKVLIAGGADSTGTPTNTAEVFDPATGKTTATANKMSSPRAFHSATLMDDNTVLIAGGATDSNADPTNSADIYDPSANSFTPTGAMTLPRAAHAAAYLEVQLIGQVLITGGATGSGGIVSTANSVEVYDPVGKVFSFVGNMNDARAFHTATVLGNGQVLLAGGFNGFGVTVFGGKLKALFGLNLNSAELFDPVHQSFTCINGSGGSGGATCNSAMAMGRGAHTATLFASGPLQGQVLIAGGLGSKRPRGTATELNEAELFNPSGSTFTRTGNMKSRRGLFNAFLLP